METETCPCKRLKCKRRGNCAACNAHHSEKKNPVACQRARRDPEEEQAASIVYTSNTGYTAEYARLLGKKLGLQACALENAPLSPPAGGIIYMGWLMAGKVQGYKKAARKYRICAVCGIGMGASGSQLHDVRKANRIPDGIPIFTLQGGFDIARLTGVYKFMMTIMAKTAGKALARKQNRTPDDDDMLALLSHGGNRVDEKNLAPVLAWYGGNTRDQNHAFK